MQEIKKIVIIGPESTGKSTLCTQLAAHYNTIWCAEYAREYLLVNGTAYAYDDLLTIAKGQLDLEDKMRGKVEERHKAEQERRAKEGDAAAFYPQPYASRLTPLIFIDTDMYVMKVWCEYVFGKCHQFILDEIVQRKYDLYLLCNTDIEWVKDELREYPDEKIRQELFAIYKDLLVNQQVPWIEIKGNYEQRLNTAIGAIDATF